MSKKINEYVNKYTDKYYNSMWENQGITNYVVVYGGRFQPFGIHHLQVYNSLTEEFGKDSVYVVTSNKVDLIKSPLNFKEKKKVIEQHGIKNIQEVKNPYVANELLSNFDDKSTGVIYVVSEKDNSRLDNSDYYLEYDGKVEYSYRNHAYVYKVPINEVEVNNNFISGTFIRKYLGDPSVNESNKKNNFALFMGFYNEDVYNMLKNKFTHIHEIISGFVNLYNINLESDYNINEVTVTGTMDVDDGPGVFFGDFNTYKKLSDKIAASVGFDVVDYMSGGYFSSVEKTGYRDTNKLTYFPTGIGIKKGKITSKPIQKWIDYAKNISMPIGYSYYNFLDSVADLQMKETQSEENPIISHAKRELKLAGLYDTDSDYNGMLAQSVVELVNKFTNQHHSGYSAMMTSNIFNKLVNWETLTPLTSNPDEWEEVSVDDKGVRLWQNKRNPKYMSYDGGKTKWNVDEYNPNGIDESLLEDYSIIYNENNYVLSEGGLAGHISHPFEDLELSFMDLKNLIHMGLSGDLQVKLNSTEKIDGINLYVTFIDNEIKCARNNTELENPISKEMLKPKYKDKPELADALYYGLQSLENFLNNIFSYEDINEMFVDGKSFLNIEVYHPKLKNVIDYDKATIVFHGFYNTVKDDTVINIQDKYLSKMKDVFRNINAEIDSQFEIRPPVVVNVNSEINFSNKRGEYIQKLKSIMNEYKLEYDNRLVDYVYLKYKHLVKNKLKEHNIILNDDIKDGVIKWLINGKDKPYNKSQLKKEINNERFMVWLDSVDRKDTFSKFIYPVEILILELGSEILKNVNGFLNSFDDKKLVSIKNDIARAIYIIKNSNNVDDINLLVKNLEKLNSIGGLDSIIPSEGVVFKYKDKMYKITGAYAPINQILRLLKRKK